MLWGLSLGPQSVTQRERGVYFEESSSSTICKGQEGFPVIYLLPVPFISFFKWESVRWIYEYLTFTDWRSGFKRSLQRMNGLKIILITQTQANSKTNEKKNGKEDIFFFSAALGKKTVLN